MWLDEEGQRDRRQQLLDQHQRHEHLTRSCHADIPLDVVEPSSPPPAPLPVLPNDDYDEDDSLHTFMDSNPQPPVDFGSEG